jgi:hypothetical protein
MPYLIKFLRYTDFLKRSGITKNTPANSQNTITNSQLDFKPSMDKKQSLVKSQTIDPEKLNQENHLFSKMNKAKIINLENVAHEVCLVFLENQHREQKIDSVLIPSNEDINYFNSVCQSEPDELKSPVKKSKSKNQPKVLMMNCNLENYGKPTSFVNLPKQKSFAEVKLPYQSLHINKEFNSYHKSSSEKLNPKYNENSEQQNKDQNNVPNIDDDYYKKDSEPKSKLNMKLINTDSSIVFTGSPSSSLNRFVKKIHNFYIYYHTVKRNVNPNYHRRQYSKSIQYFLLFF